MIFSDIITLAKAGYSPADVKDLIKLTEESGQAADQEKEPAADDKDKIIEDLKRQIEENEKELQEPEPEKESDPDPRDAEIEELKKKLELFQEAEKKKDISGLDGKKSDKEIIEDLARKFM